MVSFVLQPLYPSVKPSYTVCLRRCMVSDVTGRYYNQSPEDGSKSTLETSCRSYIKGRCLTRISANEQRLIRV
jgi:hypothetical protein